MSDQDKEQAKLIAKCERHLKRLEEIRGAIDAMLGFGLIDKELKKDLTSRVSHRIGLTRIKLCTLGAVVMSPDDVESFNARMREDIERRRKLGIPRSGITKEDL